MAEVENAGTKIKFDYEYSEETRYDSVDDIAKIMNKGLKKGFNKKEAEELIRQVLKFVCDFHNGDFRGCSLPDIEIANLKKGQYGCYSQGGEYGKNGKLSLSTQVLDQIVKNVWDGEKFKKNTIEMVQAESYKDRVQARYKTIEENPVLTLIDTIAHEFEHFQQHALEEYYNSLSEVEKQTLEPEIRQHVEMIKQRIDSQLGNEIIYHQEHTVKEEGTNKEVTDAEITNSFLMDVVPYFSGLRQLEGVLGGRKEMAKTIAGAYYLNNYNEKDARFSGSFVAQELFRRVRDSKHASKETEQWAEGSQEWSMKELSESTNEHVNQKYTKSAKIFEMSFQNDNEFFAYAKAASKNQQIVGFSAVCDYYLKGKSLDEKINIYKNAIYHGIPRLQKATWESITASPECDEKKIKTIKQEVLGHLSCGSIVQTDMISQQGEEERLCADSYSLHDINMFSEQEILDVTKSLLASNKIIFASRLWENTSLVGELPKGIEDLFNKRLDEVRENPLMEPIQNFDAYIDLCVKFKSDRQFEMISLRANALANKEMGNSDNVQKRKEKFLQAYGKRSYVYVLQESGEIEQANELAGEIISEAKQHEHLVTEKEIAQALQEKQKFLMVEKEKQEQLQRKKILEDKINAYIESIPSKDGDFLTLYPNFVTTKLAFNEKINQADIKEIVIDGTKIYLVQEGAVVHWSYEKNNFIHEQEKEDQTDITN